MSTTFIETDSGLLVPDRIIDPAQPEIILPPTVTVTERGHYQGQPVPITTLALPEDPEFETIAAQIAQPYGEYDVVLNRVAS